MIIPDAFINRIFPYLDVPYTSIQGYLREFAITHGENALQDMDAYIQWAEQNDQSASEIRETIAHDLSGRKDKFMVPRTSGYEEQI